MSGVAPPRRRVFDLSFVDAKDERTVALWLADLVLNRVSPQAGRLPVIVTPNVDQLVRLDRNESRIASSVVALADVVLPDGQPVIWASRALSAPLDSRLSGSGVVRELWPVLVDAGVATVVVASNERVATRVRAEAKNATAIAAPVMHTVEQLQCFARVVAQEVEHTGASAVFLTLGFPKQETVIDELLRVLPPTQQPWCFAIGGSFEMYYGLKRRAPLWMQRVGLEWFFRFALEPRRLFRRYFVDDPMFLRIVWREYRTGRA